MLSDAAEVALVESLASVVKFLDDVDVLIEKQLHAACSGDCT